MPTNPITQALALLDSTEQAAAAGRAEVDRIVQRYLAEHCGGVRAVARLLDLSPAYVSDIRNGRRRVSRELLLRMQKKGL